MPAKEVSAVKKIEAGTRREMINNFNNLIAIGYTSYCNQGQ